MNYFFHYEAMNLLIYLHIFLNLFLFGDNLSVFIFFNIIVETYPYEHAFERGWNSALFNNPICSSQRIIVYQNEYW